MERVDFTPAFELIFVIVPKGTGSKVLAKAKSCGVSGGTILLGKGTVDNALSKFLSLYDERKEIVLMAADAATAQTAADELNNKFQFDKPNTGIAFRTDLCELIGSQCTGNNKAEGGDTVMYQVIITIVNRGGADDVIEAAKEAGSKGGTIINARGSGANEAKRIFNIEIEPEKELVMIISKCETVEKIVDSIRRKLEIDKPGNGIIFVQDVKRAYGIYG